jgi:D-xylose transport system substrate-binding protein
MHIRSAILGILLSLATLACHPGGEESRHQLRPTGPVRIGFSMDSLQLERWQHDRDAFVARAKELGADVFVQSADGVDAVQVRQCENLLTQGIDALVIVPHNGEVMAAAVRTAKAQGIPVVSYDRLIRNSDVDVYVSFDNQRVGRIQAQYLYDRAKTGNYILIGGSPTDNKAHLIRDGQLEVLDAAIKRGEIKVVADPFAKDWLPTEALRYTEDALARVNNEVVAVVASNDSTAGGVVQALQEQNLAGRVLVSGQDSDLPAVQRVVAGTQTMTVYKPIAPLARGAAEAAVELARGTPVQTNGSVDNGAKKIPSILLDPVVVDRSNVMQTVIKDQFLKMEDVYKNVPRSQWPKESQ